MANVSKVKNQGKFQEVLSRNSDQIKESRAQSIKEDALITYSRKVEDLKREIVRKKRQRDDMLDMCPDDVNSIINAKNFDADKFYVEDTKLTLEIRDLEELFKEQNARLIELFGEDNGL